MALLFMDSFDHYTDPAKKYTNITNPTNAVIEGSGRVGNRLRLGANNATATVIKVLSTTPQTVVIGFAFMLRTGFNNQQAPCWVCQLVDGSTQQIGVSVNSTTFTLNIARNGTTIATSSLGLSLNQWYYIELKVKVDPTVGTAELRVNGAAWATFSGNTRATANSRVDRFYLGTSTSSQGGYFTYDDLYFLDDSVGAPTNDFLGDVRVDALFPNGNGNSSGMTGSDGNSTDNYLLVDENPANDDTDYVESSVVGTKDTYTYQDLVTATGTVYGVQLLPYARKTDAGARSIVSVARLSGTEVDSAAQTLGTGYVYFPDLRESKPGGGVWTIADVNSAEFGVKVNA